MKNKTILIALIFFTTIISVSAQRMCEKKQSRVIAEVEAAFQDNLKTGQNLDADKLSESVDDSPGAGHILNGVFFTSFDPVLQQTRSGMQGLKSLQYEIKNKRITVLSKNTAVAAE